MIRTKAEPDAGPTSVGRRSTSSKCTCACFGPLPAFRCRTQPYRLCGRRHSINRGRALTPTHRTHRSRDTRALRDNHSRPRQKACMAPNFRNDGGGFRPDCDTILADIIHTGSALQAATRTRDVSGKWLPPAPLQQPSAPSITDSKFLRKKSRFPAAGFAFSPSHPGCRRCPNTARIRALSSSLVAPAPEKGVLSPLEKARGRFISALLTDQSIQAGLHSFARTDAAGTNSR